MKLRYLIFFFALAVSLSGWAQESKGFPVDAPPVETDSLVPQEIVNAASPDDYMEEGYYDSIAHMEQLPTLDTGAFARMEKRYNGSEFAYEADSPNKIGLFRKMMDRLAVFLQRIFPSDPSYRFTDWVYQILGLAAIILFVWIAYRLFFSGKRLLLKDHEEHEDGGEIQFVEKNLLDIDLAPYIEKAKNEQDFALAIRYLNLLNIQLLAKKELIRWKYSKTHVELQEEIVDAALKKDFARTVSIYNRVWYGNLPLDQAKYEEYAAYFLTFQQTWR